MWLFLWVLFLCAVAGGLFWSYHVVFEQKRAWGAFARKYKLNFDKGEFLKPPSVSGLIKGRQMNLYSQMRTTPENNIQTVTSVVEVFLNTRPAVSAAVTSPGLIDYMTSLDLPAPFTVGHPEWPSRFLSRTFEDEPASEWFMADERRVKAVAMLAALPFDTAFAANGNGSFVVVRTSHPLTDPKRIGQILGKLFQVADMLDGATDVLPVQDKPEQHQQQIANPNAPSVTASSEIEESSP